MNLFLINLSLVLVAIPFFQCEYESEFEPDFGIDWTYKAQDNWSKKWDACGGKKQSPININITEEDLINYTDNFFTNLGHEDPESRLNMSSYDTPRKVIFMNSGGSAQVRPFFDDPIVIYVGKNAVPFVFERMDIHWGDEVNGSEHSIDGIYERAELQFVHFNKKYETFELAKDKKDGLAVMALLLKQATELLVDYEGLNEGLTPLIEKTARIQKYGSQIQINNFDLGKVLPPPRNFLFSYKGSLTTPPCSETATWFVFIDHDIIAENQINELRQLRDASGEKITSSRRKTQPINGRVVDIYIGPRNQN